MVNGLIHPPGRAPTKLEQLLIEDMLERRGYVFNGVGRRTIVHHITENTPHRLQLEVETREKHAGMQLTECRFRRIVIQ